MLAQTTNQTDKNDCFLLFNLQNNMLTTITKTPTLIELASSNDDAASSLWIRELTQVQMETQKKAHGLWHYNCGVAKIGEVNHE